MPKIRMRSEMLARRRQLAPDACRDWSLCIQKALIEQPEFHAAASIGLYSPIHNEVSTEYLFAVARGQGKTVAYPRVSGEKLEFVETTDIRHLVPGTFAIPEPEGSGTVAVDCLDLLVLPGVAFDLAGYRLGYGKGFYDRALHAPLRPVLFGFAFERQLVEALPSEVHDIRMDVVITEKRILRFGRPAPQLFQNYFHGGSGP